MAATVTQLKRLRVSESSVSEGSQKPYMPAFAIVQSLSAKRLHNELVSPMGPDFAKSYWEKMVFTHRGAQPTDPAKQFPSRLVSPDGTSFRTQLPCPEYVVISYTWGRWKHKTRELDTDVKGAHWKAPANKNFTRQELDHAIRKIANGSHVWMDVFCIPQVDRARGEQDEEHSREIAKQGEIFRSASRAAVWLSSGGEKTLAEICSWVPDEHYMVSLNVLQTPGEWDIQHGTVDLTEMHRRLRLVISLAEEVPWTTSLWTLQEAALRRDAIFHGKKGDPILHGKSGNPLTIWHLVKTMSEIHDALRGGYTNDEDILGYFESIQASEQVVDDWLKASDVVNRINLHNLTSMNAGQLLLTSMHRTCQRPHDRVYGIMGAIGATIDVNYEEPPEKVMNNFLIMLHNTFPAEMQSFHRTTMMRPQTRLWLADESTLELGIIRQREPPSHSPFAGVTSTGELLVTELIHISDKGLDELASRFLSMTVLPSLDHYAFWQATNGAIIPKSAGNNDHQAYIHGSMILRLTATHIQLGIIPLGTLSGLESLGWSCMYMLVGSEGTLKSPNTMQRFQRLGVLLLTEQLTANHPTPGNFLIR